MRPMIFLLPNYATFNYVTLTTVEFDVMKFESNTLSNPNSTTQCRNKIVVDVQKQPQTIFQNKSNPKQSITIINEQSNKTKSHTRL